MSTNSIHQLLVNLAENLRDSRLIEESVNNNSELINAVNDFFDTDARESAILAITVHCDTRGNFVDIESIMEFLGFNKADYFGLVQILTRLDEKGLLYIVRHGFRRRTEKIRNIEVSNTVYEALFVNSYDKYKNRNSGDLYEDIELLLENIKDERVDGAGVEIRINKLHAMYEDNGALNLLPGFQLSVSETIILFALMIESLNAGTNVKLCLENMLSDYLPKTNNKSILRRKICYESSNLNTYKLIEIAPQNYRDMLDIGLTTEAFEMLVPEDYRVKIKRPFKPVFSKLIKSDEIKSKQLYFNTQDQVRVNELMNIISREQLLLIQTRLEEKNMRKGMQVLLYGPPGTGKTETVMQIAQSSGRNVLMVEINKIKSMWVGESEKNLKKIFDEYRLALKEFEETPILLFNESDALINKRVTLSSSVDTMQNAMQNILLQELEDFEGIFIATTNLLENLDEAFNRRFLFKLKLENPEIETRKLIIKNMLGFMSETDEDYFAENYKLSGGQLENISRKAEMKYILEGTYPDFAELKEIFSSEILESQNSRTIIKGYV